MRISEAPLGWGREGGREWEVDGRKQAKVVEELLQGVVHKAWGEWRGSERVTFDRAPPRT